jgi:tRNA(fMet)-specific endonuclease VapC
MTTEDEDELQAQLSSMGHPIGVEDVMIASIALSIGLTAVSANTKHFSRISGLKVETGCSVIEACNLV